MDAATRDDPPRQPQRKLISVLFADIKGSTEMVAALDPEDALALIQPVLSLMQGAVNRFEGVVSKQAGDGVMAFFGRRSPSTTTPNARVERPCTCMRKSPNWGGLPPGSDRDSFRRGRPPPGATRLFVGL